MKQKCPTWYPAAQELLQPWAVLDNQRRDLLLLNPKGLHFGELQEGGERKLKPSVHIPFYAVLPRTLEEHLYVICKAECYISCFSCFMSFIVWSHDKYKIQFCWRLCPSSSYIFSISPPFESVISTRQILWNLHLPMKGILNNLQWNDAFCEKAYNFLQPGFALLSILIAFNHRMLPYQTASRLCVWDAGTLPPVFWQWFPSRMMTCSSLSHSNLVVADVSRKRNFWCHWTSWRVHCIGQSNCVRTFSSASIRSFVALLQVFAKCYGLRREHGDIPGDETVSSCTV